MINYFFSQFASQVCHELFLGETKSKRGKNSSRQKNYNIFNGHTIEVKISNKVKEKKR